MHTTESLQSPQHNIHKQPSCKNNESVLAGRPITLGSNPINDKSVMAEFRTIIAEIILLKLNHSLYVIATLYLINRKCYSIEKKKISEAEFAFTDSRSVNLHSLRW